MKYLPINPHHAAEAEFYGTYFDITPAECVSYFYSDAPAGDLDVYVITFNNYFMVDYQIQTLRRFLKPTFNLIVVDNNSGLHAEQSGQVLDLCIKKRVTYLRMPHNFYQNESSFDPTMKLGTTMNWLYLNCVRTRRPAYFGFLDHDCFLVRPFDMRPELERKGMYGIIVRSKISEAWNLHVTPIFYRLSFVGDLPLDWRASYPHQLDTGGANYDLLYKSLDPDIYDTEYHSIRFSEADVNRKDSVQHYQVIDGGRWYHMIASSHDQLVGDGLYKLAYTKGFLDARLES